LNGVPDRHGDDFPLRLPSETVLQESSEDMPALECRDDTPHRRRFRHL